MSNYMPPWLDQPSLVRPKHEVPRFGWILIIAAAVALAGFLAALITAIVTAGGG